MSSLVCRLVIDRPLPGRLPVAVSIQCRGTTDVKDTVRELNKRSSKRAIKNSISASVDRATGTSGLKTGQGRLQRHASQNFDVSVRQLFQNELEIRAIWREADFPYFLIQLWGGTTGPHEIRPRNKQALFWQGIAGGRPVRAVRHPGATIAPHDFIRLDRQVERDVNTMLARLRRARQPETGAVAPTSGQIAQAKRVVGIAEAIALDIMAWKSRGRLTQHQIRRILRRHGLSALAARTIAPVFERFKRRQTVPPGEVAILILGLV